MTFDEIRQADWFKTFVAIVVGVFLLRIFLPIITIVAIAGLGLFLIVVLLDAAFGGSAWIQITQNITNWLSSFF